MELTTDFPENIKPGTQVYLGNKKTPVKISSLRQANNLWLVSLAGYEDSESVENFRNQWIYMEKTHLKPLPRGRYYHHEIIGIKVLNENREPLGEVTEIMVTGANDVYVVKLATGSELLLPAIKTVILSVDLEKREIIAKPQEWI